MFGIGLPELIIILVVALLVVGPSKLPEVARSIGKALGDLRRMTDEVKDTLEHDFDREEAKEGSGQPGDIGETAKSGGELDGSPPEGDATKMATESDSPDKNDQKSA